MPEAYMRETTQGSQVCVFNSYSVRNELKARGYRFGSLPRPRRKSSGAVQYDGVEKGWYSLAGVDQETERQFLLGVGCSVTSIALDEIGRIINHDEARWERAVTAATARKQLRQQLGANRDWVFKNGQLRIEMAKLDSYDDRWEPSAPIMLTPEQAAIEQEYVNARSALRSE